MRKIMLALAALLAASALSAQDAARRAAELVGKMTLEEKISILGGCNGGFYTYPVERLGIPSIRMADGPQGVRNDTESTLYPSGIAAAASWSREGVRAMGEGIGMDAKARGVGIMLGPGVNIYRSPLNGRNFEYYGEDPFLASETAVEYIKGLQSTGIIATIKHFALNNSEFDRHGLSSNADERTINEIYFPAFRRAVQDAGVGAVMTSYNLINGVHAAEDPWLTKTVLRDSWGFKGITMSDWRSTYTTLGCMRSGLDLEMPQAFMLNYKMIKPLLDNGVVSEEDIDLKVRHILQTFIEFGFLDGPVKDTSIPEDRAESHEAALSLAVEAPVLLKNEGVLPLKPGRKNRIAVLGPDAFNMPRGGGSGNVHTPIQYRISVAQGLQSLGRDYPVDVVIPVGDRYDTPANIKTVEAASAVVVAVGFDLATEKEGADRSYTLPKGQEDVINFALAHNSKVIVVLFSGGEVDLGKWGDRVQAILAAWYPGESGGTAIARILSGRVNPSGRLPFTWWGSLNANPAAGNYHPTQAFRKAGYKKPREAHDRYQYAEYAEGVFLGYRGVEHFGVEPRYPFGYGLSYTEFAYSGLSVTPSADGADVEFTVTNTGSRAGAEVAQVYVAPTHDSGVLRPARELKGFEKLRLAKGESRVVKIHLDGSAFSYYSTPDHAWKIDSGSFEIQVGKSSSQIELRQAIEIK